MFHLQLVMCAKGPPKTSVRQLDRSDQIRSDGFNVDWLYGSTSSRFNILGGDTNKKDREWKCTFTHKTEKWSNAETHFELRLKRQVFKLKNDFQIKPYFLLNTQSNTCTSSEQSLKIIITIGTSLFTKLLTKIPKQFCVFCFYLNEQSEICKTFSDTFEEMCLICSLGSISSKIAVHLCCSCSCLFFCPYVLEKVMMLLVW